MFGLEGMLHVLAQAEENSNLRVFQVYDPDTSEWTEGATLQDIDTCHVLAHESDRVYLLLVGRYIVTYRPDCGPEYCGCLSHSPDSLLWATVVEEERAVYTSVTGDPIWRLDVHSVLGSGAPNIYAGIRHKLANWAHGPRSRGWEYGDYQGHLHMEPFDSYQPHDWAGEMGGTEDLRSV
ncbi:hypothetical protein KIPB_008311 [Kipferlia bialata]|uniref:Uncharacterized protein n=1 Tax=Kipferlia bialata TaxID=797122 RepID=A0A9K3D2M0_9EUKA|nr:hypothetical protein KIPB_008311 [Kipferlia bialata]|eukprot:g8311.t1